MTTNKTTVIEYIVHGFNNGLLYDFKLLWSINLSMNMTFRPVGPCSRIGVMCVASES